MNIIVFFITFSKDRNINTNLVSKMSYLFIFSEEDGQSSHMLFTLHVYQYRIEKANQAGIPGGMFYIILL